MKINLLICGKFHYFNYANYLFQEEFEGRLYFSHSLKSNVKIGLPPNNLHNAFLKEYLVKLHLKLLGQFGMEKLFPIYESLWRRSVLRHWFSADICHYLANGTTLEILRKIDSNTILLADAVNTHPFWRRDILQEEASYRKLDKSKYGILNRHHRQIDEIGMSDSLLVPSSIVERSYIEHGYNKQIFKVPYCANVERFSPKQYASHKKLKIVSIGRIGLRKGQLYLLEALAPLGDHCELTLVGYIDAELKNNLHKYSGKYKHIQSIPSEQMPAFLSDFDIYIAPSLEEGLSVSIGEAMATGLTVICTEESGGPELIKDGINGFIIESRSAKAIQDSVTKILDQPRHLIQKVGLAASEEMRKEYKWNSYADVIKSIYQRLLKGNTLLS